MITPWFMESFYGDFNLHVTFLRFISSGIEGDFLPRPIGVGKVPPAGDLGQRGRQGVPLANSLQGKIQELTPSCGIKLLATIAAK